jgi:hypothetical protein
VSNLNICKIVQIVWWYSCQQNSNLNFNTRLFYQRIQEGVKCSILSCLIGNSNAIYNLHSATSNFIAFWEYVVVLVCTLKCFTRFFGIETFIIIKIKIKLKGSVWKWMATYKSLDFSKPLINNNEWYMCVSYYELLICA